MGNWNNFFLPYVMLPGSASTRCRSGLTQMLSSTPRPSTRSSGPAPQVQLPQLALATLISVAPVLVIFLVAQRFLVSGLTAGATKE